MDRRIPMHRRIFRRVTASEVAKDLIVALAIGAAISVAVAIAHASAEAHRRAVEQHAAEARIDAFAIADRNRQAREMEAYRRGYAAAAAQAQRCQRWNDFSL